MQYAPPSPTKITDDDLAQLAALSPGGDHLALDPTAVADIAAELLRWRVVARERPVALSLALRSEAIAATLKNARTTIFSAKDVGEPALADACFTLLRHSQNQTERNAAQDLLDQIGAAA